MFSKILVKLIDQSIVPATMLITARIVSLMLIARYFGVPFSLNSKGFTYPEFSDYLLVNSYSTLAMVIVLTVGILFILMKSLLFHETHVSPKTTASMFSLKLSSFIQSSYDLYSQATVWLSYSYLLTMVTWVMAFFGLLYTWVFYASLVLTIIATILLAHDIETELSLRGETVL